MLWTRDDEMALASAKTCIQNCSARRIKPAPVFRTLIRAYEALERAGLIEREDAQPEDLCRGCAEELHGGCRQGYRAASLSLDGKRVVKCLMRRGARV